MHIDSIKIVIMKTLQKVTLVMALLCLVVMTSSCKKENSGDTTPKSRDLTIKCGLSDAYHDLANISIELTDHNGNKIVETLTKDLPDHIISEGRTINLFKKTFTIDKFPATLTWKYNITKKDLQGNYNLPCLQQHEDGSVFVKDLGEGYGAWEVQQGGSLTVLWTPLSKYPDGLSIYVDRLNKTVFKVTIDKDGNVVTIK